MDLKHLLELNLHWATEKTISLIDTMRDAPLTFPTPRGGNHPLWVLGHCTFAEGQVIWELMQAETNPMENWSEMFRDGTEPTSNPEDYLPFDDVMHQCRALRKASDELLASFNLQDLERPTAACPPGYEEHFGTFAQCYLFVANHWLMHRGQVADARRALNQQAT